MRSPRLADVAFAFAVGLIALGSIATASVEAQPVPPSPPVPSAVPSPQTEAQATQTLVDFAFDPPTITAQPGATVTWTNDGPTIHTVGADDYAWSSDVLLVGDTYSYAFAEPGIYTIICTLHPEMTGTVVVQ